MKSFRIYSGFFVFMILALIPMVPVKADIPLYQPGTKIRAVVVGINRYQYPHSLKYCVNDAITFGDICKSIGAHVVELLDEKATRVNVMNALKTAISDSEKSDILIFYYSGHGSAIPDTNHDEPDEWDETLVLYGADMPDIGGIIDDEMDEMMSKCNAKTTLIVLDSCFSSGGAKGCKSPNGTELGLREQDQRPGRTNQYITPDQVDRYGFMADKPTNPREIVITSSRAYQKSREEEDWNPPAERQHGYFTYYFKDALTNGTISADTNGDRVISILEIYNYCFDKINSLTCGLQKPTLYFGSQADQLNLFRLDADGNLINAGDLSPTDTYNVEQAAQDMNNIGQITTITNNQENNLPKIGLSARLDKDIYNVGDIFDVRISVNAQCYMYFFNLMLGGDVQQVFPNGEVKTNIINPGQEMTIDKMIPGYDLAVVDSMKGPNFFLVIASPYPIPIEKIFPNVKHEKGIRDLESNYGLKGKLSKLNDAVQEGKNLVLKLKKKQDSQPDLNNLLSQYSLNAVIVPYTVE